MSPTSQARRDVLATAAAVSAFNLICEVALQAAEGNDIRPFPINVPEHQLVELRRRIVATLWRDRETVSDESRVPLATMQDLARYRATGAFRRINHGGGQ